MDMFTEEFLQPLEFYYEKIKGMFREKASIFYDELVKKSNINIELNRKLSEEYKALSQKFQKFQNSLDEFYTLKKLTEFLIFISIVFIPIFFYKNRADYNTKNILIAIGVIIFSILMAILRKKYILVKIKVYEEICTFFKEKCENKLKECYSSIDELNRLMDSKYTAELLNENIPFVKLDPYFDLKRFEEMHYIYGMSPNDDVNYSTLEAISGNILGNPFVVLKRLKHEIIQHTYEGSLEISWTEYYTDSSGKKQSRTRYETLYATVEKPKPEYEDCVYFILANDVAPNLCFERKPNHIEKLSDSELKRKIKKDEKKLEKLERESISKGNNFVKMANTEFEVLFNALNRDNETEFRLLFTPLAQKNIINLLKNKEYGDNFYFLKNKKINTIIAEHTKNWDLDCDYKKFKTYSYEDGKENFINFNTNYMENFFFALAPLLSIPLYQQYMSKDYIYKNKFNKNYNSHIAESLVNAIDLENFSHPLTKTKTILKTSHILSKGKTDLVRVIAYSYDMVKRTEYVEVRGGDGKYHRVPVPWYEYIPLTKKASTEIKRLNIDDNRFEEISKTDAYFSNKKKFVYKNKIFAKVSTVIQAEEKLKNIVNV